MKPLLIFIAFALAAILGTLQHELGHYLVAEAQGFDAELHYGFTSLDNSSELIAAAKKNGTIQELRRKFANDTLGGPMMTMLTGTAGLIVLLILRRRDTIDAYKPLHLLWIIVALCWSREIYVSSFNLYKYYVLGKAGNADELKLLAYYGVPQWLGLGTLFIVSFSICLFVCFKIVQLHKWQLIFYGVAGSMAGAAFWFLWLGPVLLP